ncbi:MULTISPECIES: PH domain-containing protein [Micromonospora]|uniref:PH domain-containing protein n=1 Tax=Micromonospora musae TaxID=1894970 RepID=A0A3A9XVY3_9ACTN|nr:MULTISPECIES: PH domain-containing protein [Micromonospora]RKN23796.1 PH domain-containing protein [Micromonospora musae]RKN25704.1 PH domain-containing protein [Micromonospora musae]TYB99107.1 PH domain-containing protein [Micromonospora sp. WP24]
MGSPPGPPFDPDDPDRERRERDTEPIPRVPPDEGPGYGSGAGLSDGPSFSDDAGYGDGPGYAGEGRSGRSWIRDPEGGYQQPVISEDELAGLRADAAGNTPRRVLPLEDEPSSLVARYLFPTERYRGEWKRHWIHLATPILIGIAATFVLGYLSGFLAGQDVGALTTVAVLLWFAVMGWVAWRVADWWYDRFILTNKRVMVVNGIITRRVAMMPLVRVTDMKYEQTPTGRALNYGTFVLESAGQEQALREIKNLPNPNELYLRVVEEMYEPQAVEARLGKEADEAKADDGA